MTQEASLGLTCHHHPPHSSQRALVVAHRTRDAWSQVWVWVGKLFPIVQLLGTTLHRVTWLPIAHMEMEPHQSLEEILSRCKCSPSPTSS
jgi:hypothetical protein